MATRKEAPVQPIPVVANSAPSVAGPAVAALKNETEAANVYKEGQSAYWGGNYTTAISLFSQVKAIDPDYKSRNLETYLNLATYRLLGDKPGRTRVFLEPTPESTTKSEVLINDSE